MNTNTNTELQITVGDRFVCKFEDMPVVFELRNIIVSDNTVKMHGVYLDVFGDVNEKELDEDEIITTIEIANKLFRQARW